MAATRFPNHATATAEIDAGASQTAPQQASAEAIAATRGEDRPCSA